ncbi:uncharacterized protein [Argopecten irradians]|uniref:uncharacterized protein n=1 Tax=Argopecten irradians TaxID=31199 RepID=UPI0037232F94
MSDINVAVGKPANQSSTHSIWVPDKAVDNCTKPYVESGCCSHTDPINRTTNAHWDVDLGQLMTIDDITIYYRAGYAKRFGGYQIYVYNVTSTIPTLCYSDMSSAISDVKLTVTHQCPYVIRYVQVYNYRLNPKRHEWYSDHAILELCEVQVWGCPVGRYGDGNCDSVCSGKCYGGNCNATTGACFYCAPQKYGDKCDNDCSINCLNQICEKDTGNCNGNVAISGTAQQSSNMDNTRWLAKQAVDGCVQTTITSGCCSHTRAIGPNTAWWRVDLGTLVTINAITIYYRDNSQYRLARYELVRYGPTQPLSTTRRRCPLLRGHQYYFSSCTVDDQTPVPVCRDTY